MVCWSYSTHKAASLQLLDYFARPRYPCWGFWRRISPSRPFRWNRKKKRKKKKPPFPSRPDHCPTAPPWKRRRHLLRRPSVEGETRQGSLGRRRATWRRCGSAWRRTRATTSSARRTSTPSGRPAPSAPTPPPRRNPPRDWRDRQAGLSDRCTSSCFLGITCLL